MRKGGGKAKGSGWERDICRFLTKWVSGQEKPYIFWRTPGSGSFVTNNVSTDASGDIISILPEGRFFTDIISCEAKIGYDEIDLFKHFKDVKNNTLESFWCQCIRDANKSNKYGMLVYKKSGYKPMVGVDDRLINELHMKLPKSIVVFFNESLPKMVLFDMESFFNSISPENIKNIYKRDPIT